MRPIRRLLLFAAAAALCLALPARADAHPIDQPTLSDHALHVDASPAVNQGIEIVCEPADNAVIALNAPALICEANPAYAACTLAAVAHGPREARRRSEPTSTPVPIYRNLGESHGDNGGHRGPVRLC